MAAEADLFSVDPAGDVAHRLDAYRWPSPGRFPVNRASAKVRPVVWHDLLESGQPMIVAGYASVAQLIDFVSEWASCRPSNEAATVRVLLGGEPYPTARRDFSSTTAGFTEEVQRYWLEERGISLQHSARIVQVLEAIDRGQLSARFLHGTSRLHAKIYVGANAATLGSSNFTAAGLSDQVEVNARFEAERDRHRYDELVGIAENLWSAATDWTAELRELLEGLLQVVGWREALARACAELLEGEWAERYLGALPTEAGALWPSQRAGIAQALWVTKDVGSVLVADATGSGKTRMGAHLVRALRDRLWSSGRVRRDLCVLVSPPAITATWKREAFACGLSLDIASHGMLSRTRADGPRMEEEAVARAQILAVDEAHNFLNREANRTQQLRRSRADHVLLFTATPINRGPGDLLALVSLLGADNFDDSTLATLSQLAARRGSDQVLSGRQLDVLRTEIARFTVRRTKSQLNDLVERDPGSYTHPESGRVCRYPAHDARTYPTGETAGDEEAATLVRQAAAGLSGIARLERRVSVPLALRSEYSDERWLAFRLRSTHGLALHQVLAALRSSRAALVEHLEGTAAAVGRYGLGGKAKPAPTGNVIARLDELATQGPPEMDIACPAPDWLTDPGRWAEECHAEQSRYRAILELVSGISPARERAKAAVIIDLATRRERVLAFDQHPITLAALAGHLHERGLDPVVATGSDQAGRQRVETMFRRTATGQAVALCSDALNEGLNLQGAAAVVHLDLPTTLRVAEQRVGRVDRMDSPHDRIEVLWPKDGPAFATRANELLAQRSDENARLLGSNLPIPDLTGETDAERIVNVEDKIAEAEQPGAEQWDGIRDALDPVRRLVGGNDPLLAPEVYERLRQTPHRVIARVSLLRTHQPWAFLAVAGSSDGAPRWHFLDGPHLQHTAGDLGSICARLRHELSSGPPGATFDPDAADLLERALEAASRQEFRALPQRMQRALQQMRTVLQSWALAARQAADEHGARVLHSLADLAQPRGADTAVDPYLVAERWLTLVAPTLDAHRRRQHRRPYVLLSDITPTLRREPLPVSMVTEAFADLPELTPLAERVTACILGVPGPARETAPTVPAPLPGASR